MITSHQRQFLSPILDWKPIPRDTLTYFQERLHRSLHSAILDAFKIRFMERGLTQKELARRIHKSPVTVNRWLSTASNLTLDSISDLMVGLGMDFDEFPFTPIEKTIVTAEQEQQQAEKLAALEEKLHRKLLHEAGVELYKMIAAEQERSFGSSATTLPLSPSASGAPALPVEALQKRASAKVYDFAAYAQRQSEKVAEEKMRANGFLSQK